MWIHCMHAVTEEIIIFFFLVDFVCIYDIMANDSDK